MNNRLENKNSFSVFFINKQKQCSSNFFLFSMDPDYIDQQAREQNEYLAECHESHVEAGPIFVLEKSKAQLIDGSPFMGYVNILIF